MATRSQAGKIGSSLSQGAVKKVQNKGKSAASGAQTPGKNPKSDAQIISQLTTDINETSASEDNVPITTGISMLPTLACGNTLSTEGVNQQSTAEQTSLPTLDQTALTASLTAGSTDLTALLFQSLMSVAESVERINKDNKQHRLDMQELRAQLATLNKEASEVNREEAQPAQGLHTLQSTPYMSSADPDATQAANSPLADINAIEVNREEAQPAQNLHAMHSTPRIPSATTSSFRQQNSTYVEDVGARMCPLPIFTGKPEDWPLFLVSYNDTTFEFGYSNRQNLIRLQRAVQGDARQTVVSLLIHPDNVPQVIEELRFNFGRPEILVRSQLQQLQQIAVITENNADGIIYLSNKVRNIVALFKAAGCKEQLMNPTLLEQLLSKLPRSKQFEWAKHAATVNEYVTVDHFSNWISDLAKIVCFMPASTKQGGNVVNTTAYSGSHPKRMLHTSQTNNKYCSFCKGAHIMTECEKFKALKVDKRWEVVKEYKLCISCLKPGHRLSNCYGKRSCGMNECQRIHNRLLHSSEEQTSQLLSVCTASENKQLFRILPVVLRGPHGQITTFAMFDEGSSITLLEDQTAYELGLRGQSSPLSLQWYDDRVKTEMSKRVTVEISGVNQNAMSYVMKNVRTIRSLRLPRQTFIRENYENLKSLPISNYTNVNPVLLIGLDNCQLGLPVNIVESGESLPVAAETKLGWVAYGCSNVSAGSRIRVCHVREMQPMKQMLNLMEKYWSIENEGNEQTTFESDETIYAKNILIQTTKLLDKQYEVGLLWREANIDMPPSFDMAKKRLLQVEQKMKTNSEYAQKYQQEMQKYIEKNYARILKDDELEISNGRVWYLPHFGVENPNKPKKLRIVFDAAATVSNISLNSCLSKGSERAKSMINVLLQFREGSIGVAADIQEMFSQIKIRSEDQHAQRFLWRNGNSNEPVRCYAMTSMIFGATCSPCCAEYVKNLNAQNHLESKPHAAKAIINNMYVDDLAISFPDVKTALAVVSQVIAINADAGFNLRGIVSNANKVEQYFNDNAMKSTDHVISHGLCKESERILGLYWNKVNDTFEFRLKFHKIRQEVLDDVRPPTKREMLGIIMAIFDPLGFLANITVSPKVMMQQIWKLKVPWDAPIPTEIYKKWSRWWLQFRNVESLSVPRCYTILLPNADDVKLHIFVDASENAYAAVAYLCVYKGNQINTAFVAAKSRVAPVKPTTIPRLELQAALLGARLKKLIASGHSIKILSTTFWSDSKTVVLWIHSTKRDYDKYVGVRVAEILEHSHKEDWRWLPTALNVADEATRVTTTIKTSDASRWLNGPAFLSQPEKAWPKQDILTRMSDESKHVGVVTVHKNKTSKVINFDRFSSLYKLQKHVAWLCRAASAFKGSKTEYDALSADELENARKRICIWVQQESFAEELLLLVKGEKILKSSDLYQLTPFLDDDGLIKIQGRLNNAVHMPAAHRHPVIMPNKHHVTSLIMRNYHEKLHHQNNDLTINEMRQHYWVPRIKSLLQRVQKNCSLCVVSKAKPTAPLMGQLPQDRLTPYLRPFSYTGVDYCGPFDVAIGRRREKRWVALFTCLNTRAVHLEIANSLSSDAFILCFRNFINRRGTPVRMRSDNGTNFVKASKEINQASRLFDVAEIKKTLAKDNIEWVFNCPANPHAGGCWERLVKIVKRLMHQTLNTEAPQLATFNSVLIEIENIVNSRPLTDLPIGHEEEEPLTPNHFLLGCLNSTQTPAKNEQPCLRRQWLIAQNLKDRLWKRWTLEYLPQLLVPQKWHERVTPLKEGQLVIIIDHALPRSQWKRGRIVKVYTAADGQVRSADVKTATGMLKRPAIKLAVLNFCESSMAEKNSRGAGCKI